MKTLKRNNLMILTLVFGVAIMLTQSAFKLSTKTAEYKYINTGVHYIKVDDADLSGCSWVTSSYYCVVETNTDMGSSFAFSQLGASGATPVAGASLSVYEQ
ncbi:hypothetical protein [Pedobacter sp. Hv1]|uniref:hypothetical protein n=1 Tax=Pedobacter sp. Hv1 TaxID=1740090 RepID=UPI0006D896CA|nr:hypothetical protein [Pedobacter sp. Hv1]KQC02284.1 hypothetical protein AQF98_01530 [Pedobacter sp. Hv1]